MPAILVRSDFHHRDSNGRKYYTFTCACGNILVLRQDSKAKSCGCLPKKNLHGYAYDPLYGVWEAMKQRCLNPNDKGYKNYGGRGITIYPDWIIYPEKFIQYILSLAHAKEVGYSIDRIKNNEGYFPGNLQWSDRTDQILNRRPWGTNR